jgi:hypothetical protein
VKERLVGEVEAHGDSSGFRLRSASVCHIILGYRCRLVHEPVDCRSVIAVAGLVEPPEETDEALLVIDDGSRQSIGRCRAPRDFPIPKARGVSGEIVDFVIRSAVLRERSVPSTIRSTLISASRTPTIAIGRHSELPPVSMDFQRSRLTDFQRRPFRLLLADIEKYGVLKLR